LTKVGVDGYASYQIRTADKLLERQNYRAAKPRLEAALRARPTSATLHLRVGRLCRQLDLLPEAAEHLRAARRIEGETEEYQLEMLMVQAQAGHGEFLYDKLWIYVLLDRPQAPLVCEALARCFLAQELYHPAVNQIDRWLEKEPNNVQALYMKGYCMVQLGSSETAVHLLQEALERDPERDDVEQVLAFALGDIDRYNEAVVLHERVLQKHPSDGLTGLALLGLARCRQNQGQLDNARELLDQAVAADPWNAEVLAERGKVAMLLEQPEEAESWLRKALKLDASNRLANFQLQSCLTRLGRDTEAMAVAEANRKRDKDMERLQTILSKEIVTNVSSPLYHEVGKLLLENGREEGLLWLYKALVLDPMYEPSNRLLAEYWEKQGDPDRAKIHRARLRRK
jgi:tetratricopeptide (TPR) repeat protein